PRGSAPSIASPAAARWCVSSRTPMRRTACATSCLPRSTSTRAARMQSHPEFVIAPSERRLVGDVPTVSRPYVRCSMEFGIEGDSSAESAAPPLQQDLDALLTVAELAAILKVNKSWAYEHSRSRGTARSERLESTLDLATNCASQQKRRPLAHFPQTISQV